MRSVILNVAVTLDGLIEGPNGEYDWCFTDQDYGMTDFLQRVDTLFMGRSSYELMQAQEEDYFTDKQWFVFSNTLTQVSMPGVSLIDGDWVDAVYAIKNQPGGDLWLFGGASLTTSFLNARLVDEVLLSVHPLLLGAGKPLFQQLREPHLLELLHTQTYNTGLVQLHYRIRERRN